MKEKRIGPDRIVNLISWISMLSWAILALILVGISIKNPSSTLTASIRPSFFSGGGDWAGVSCGESAGLSRSDKRIRNHFQQDAPEKKNGQDEAEPDLLRHLAVAGIFISAFER
jgi:hypothetical protein